MATCRLILDKAARHNNGLCPIKLVITNSGSTCRIFTGYLIKDSQWGASESVIKHENAKSINAVIRSMRNRAEDLCMQATLDYGPRFPVSIIRDQIEHKNEEPDHDIYNTFQEIINDPRKAPGTTKTYVTAYHMLCEYTNNEKIAWEDMDLRWLDGLDQFMTRKGLKANSKALIFSRIRSVFNHARKLDYTEKYPFLRFQIKHEKTRHRSLTLTQLRGLFELPCTGRKRWFLLSAKIIFFLRGISAKDVCYLENKNVINSNIEYKRFKTGKLYTIKIEPEMQKIIDELHTPGSKYLLPFLDKYSNYTHFSRKLNEVLESLSKDNILPSGVTSYWFRHTWATIASELDIPKETISAGLGHEIGSEITSIYIDYDQKKVDEANRRILDYVLYNKDYRKKK